jgi:hypothetical protein
MRYGFRALSCDFLMIFERCRDGGYANAIYPKVIHQSLKRRNFVYTHNSRFVQCVSPRVMIGWVQNI